MNRLTQDLIAISLLPWMAACCYVSIWIPLPKLAWMCIAFGPHFVLMPIACYYSLTREESVPPLIREAPDHDAGFPRSYRGPSDLDDLDTILRDAVLPPDGFRFDADNKRFTMEFWQRDLQRRIYHRQFWPIYTDATPFRQYRLDLENVCAMATKISEDFKCGEYSLGGITFETNSLVIHSHYCLDEIRLETKGLIGTLNEMDNVETPECSLPCRTVLLLK